MLNIFSYVHLPSVESLNCMEIKWVNPKGNPCWIYIGRTDAEAPILWPRDAKNWLMEKDPEERLKAGGEGDDRGWDGWMASPIQWPRVWASSRSWWWTGKPGMLQSMGSQRVGHDWVPALTDWLFLPLQGWMSVSLPQNHMSKPNPQSDEIRKWGIWVVIRSWGWNPYK